MQKIPLIVLAGGRGARMGALISKVFLTLWVRPPVLHGDEVQKLLHERLPVDLKLGEIS